MRLLSITNGVRFENDDEVIQLVSVDGKTRVSIISDQLPEIFEHIRKTT